MKGALLYYSATGNTQLACRYISNRVKGLDLLDMSSRGKPSLDRYDLVGLACPTHYLNIPLFVRERLQELNPERGKPAFILVTYGVMPGKALRNLAGVLKDKGFNIFAYHALRMPESYPPFMEKQLGDEYAPDRAEMNAYDAFIRRIGEAAGRRANGLSIRGTKIRTGFFNSVIPAPSFKKIMKDFGSFRIDRARCRNCAACLSACPYGAVTFKQAPLFNREKCRACYSCYHKCPQKAITTEKLAGDVRYPGPGPVLKEKMT